MDRTVDQFTPRQGMSVYGSDNEKVGDVDAVEQDYFIVRKGFFFPEDHFIPFSAVDTYDDENIYLAYTKDQALEQQWSTPPAATGTVTDTDYATDTTGTAGLERDGEPYVHDQTSQDTHVNEDDDLRVDIHEEDLVARKREVDRGSVGITKNVVAEEETIDVPVTEERVEVTRRAVDRDVTPGEDVFDEGTIEVPVRGEEVDVEKRTRVTGEVDVDKVAEQHTERVSDTVRREEVTVDGDEVDDTRRR